MTPPATPRFDWPMIAATLGTVAAMLLGYETLGWGTDPARARTLMTPWDAAVPFVPWTIFAYSMVYASSLYPIFVIRERQLLMAVIRAAALLLAVSFAVYWAFPVTSAPLRVDVASLDPRRFDHWAVRLTYAADPPVNCFPSLHLAFAVLSMLAGFSARPLWGWVALPNVVGIGASILTMKQHYIADGAAGLLLAAGLWRWQVRPVAVQMAAAGQQLARSWRGPAVFAALAVAVYAVFYALFSAGWRCGS